MAEATTRMKPATPDTQVSPVLLSAVPMGMPAALHRLEPTPKIYRRPTCYVCSLNIAR